MSEQVAWEQIVKMARAFLISTEADEDSMPELKDALAVAERIANGWVTSARKKEVTRAAVQPPEVDPGPVRVDGEAT